MAWDSSIATVAAAVISVAGAVVLAEVSSPLRVRRAERLLRLLDSVPQSWEGRDKIEARARFAVARVVPPPIPPLEKLMMRLMAYSSAVIAALLVGILIPKALAYANTMVAPGSLVALMLVFAATAALVSIALFRALSRH